MTSSRNSKAEKVARISMPKNAVNKPKNQWQALQIARQMDGKIPESQILVGGAGFEPAASSTSTTRSNQMS